MPDLTEQVRAKLDAMNRYIPSELWDRDAPVIAAAVARALEEAFRIGMQAGIEAVRPSPGRHQAIGVSYETALAKLREGL